MKYVGELRIKILVNQGEDGPSAGLFLKARPVGGIFGGVISYQILDGDHMGKEIKWNDCVEIIEEGETVAK